MGHRNTHRQSYFADGPTEPAVFLEGSCDLWSLKESQALLTWTSVNSGLLAYGAASKLLAPSKSCQRVVAQKSTGKAIAVLCCAESVLCALSVCCWLKFLESESHRVRLQACSVFTSQKLVAGKMRASVACGCESAARGVVWCSGGVGLRSEHPLHTGFFPSFFFFGRGSTED